MITPKINNHSLTLFFSLTLFNSRINSNSTNVLPDILYSFFVQTKNKFQNIHYTWLSCPLGVLIQPPLSLVSFFPEPFYCNHWVCKGSLHLRESFSWLFFPLHFPEVNMYRMTRPQVNIFG